MLPPTTTTTNNKSNAPVMLILILLVRIEVAVCMAFHHSKKTTCTTTAESKKKKAKASSERLDSQQIENLMRQLDGLAKQSQALDESALETIVAPLTKAGYCSLELGGDPKSSGANLENLLVTPLPVLVKLFSTAEANERPVFRTWNKAWNATLRNLLDFAAPNKKTSTNTPITHTHTPNTPPTKNERTPSSTSPLSTAVQTTSATSTKPSEESPSKTNNHDTASPNQTNATEGMNNNNNNNNNKTPDASATTPSSQKKNKKKRKKRNVSLLRLYLCTTCAVPSNTMPLCSALFSTAKEELE
jgi:hypothetical protein